MRRREEKGIDFGIDIYLKIKEVCSKIEFEQCEVSALISFILRKVTHHHAITTHPLL
jgi:hypothetical protein